MKKYNEKPIGKMNEDELAMERFVQHGKDEIIEEGQCVKCENNVGANACTALVKKPDDYKFGVKKCPERKVRK